MLIQFNIVYSFNNNINNVLIIMKAQINLKLPST